MLKGFVFAVLYASLLANGLIATIKLEQMVQKQQMAIDASSANSTRMNALRRAVAKQNAGFGAQGVGTGDGSSEAVLLGLVNQSDQAKANQDALTTLKSQAIDQNLAQKKNVDMLQQAQLQQKQNLQRIIQDA